MTTHADRKADYQAYRKAARHATEIGLVVAFDDFDIKVEPTAGVSLCDDGAYVDAVIWVPRRVMEEAK